MRDIHECRSLRLKFLFLTLFLNLDLTFLSTWVFGGFCAIFLNVVVSGRIFLKVYSTPVFFFH